MKLHLTCWIALALCWCGVESSAAETPRLAIWSAHEDLSVYGDLPILPPSGSPDKGPSRLHQPAPDTRCYRGRIAGGDRYEVWFVNPTEGPVTIPYALALHLELRSHSPSGFAWGYGGSGPAQLALALLMNVTGDPELALQRYHDFKWARVSAWGEDWSITAGEIRRFLSAPSSPERKHPLFPMGSIFVTPAVMAVVTTEEMQIALRRHLTGDWGELGSHDWAANHQALVEGARLLSAYMTKSGHRFWIITEADRSRTTILLPEDY